MPEEININIIKVKFKEALDKLYQNDYSLITRKCSERSIVFRLGLYLSKGLEHRGLSVDCEYNKNGYRPKALLEKRFNYPDIIVHKRESNENNLLIVEVKTPNDTQPAHFQNDADKLRGFTQEPPYSYQLGVHVYISATSCYLVWYIAGDANKYLKYQVDRTTHTLLPVDPNNPQNQTVFEQWYINKWGNIFM